MHGKKGEKAACGKKMDNAVILYAGRWPPKLKLARAVLKLHDANFVRPFGLKVVAASFDSKPFSCDPHRDAHDLTDLVIETFGRDAVHAVRTFANRSGHEVYSVASIPNFGSVTSTAAGTARSLAGTIASDGTMTITAGGANTLAIGQLTSELTIK